MTYFNEDDLRAKARQVTRSISKSASHILHEKYDSQSKRHYNIFLSHSKLDEELILGVREELTEKGYSVYIDWIDDPQLNRTDVSKNTANRLREMMKCSDCMLFATSANSPNSKWMPWELGFFDGHKPKKVAIFPIIKNKYSTDPSRQEYLDLYPIFEKGSTNTIPKENIFVISEDNGKVHSFAQWLKL